MKKRSLGILLLVSVLIMGCGKEQTTTESDEKAVADNSLEASSTEEHTEKTLEKLEVTDVTWTADHINNAVISFDMSDETVQEMDTGLAMDIKSMEMIDIDNDGEDEYVIHGYFVNTVGENYPIYVYKLEDNTVKQIFPNQELEDLKDEPVFSAELSTIDLNEDTLNAIKVRVYDKIEGIGYEKLYEVIYCQEGEWQVDWAYSDPNAAFHAYMEPRSAGDFIIDETTRELYSGFMNGTVKARYDADGDLGGYITLSDVLVNGEEATLDEILQKLTAEGQYAESMTEQSREDSYIDCGIDGNAEMLVNVSFDTEFSLQLLVKNVDGTLVISTSSCAWSRKSVTYNVNGIISCYGSGGANNHCGDIYYVDAAGKTHLWYTFTEEGINKFEGSFSYDDVVVKLPDEVEYMLVGEIYFEKEITDSTKFYYSLTLYDADFNVIEGEAVDTAIKAFVDAGHDAKTEAEGEIALEERKQAIGLTDDIYNYGREYCVEEN